MKDPNLLRAMRMRSLMLLAGAVLCCPGAWAAPPVSAHKVMRSETVKYRPSQLSTEEGAARLYQSLRRAAERVCEDSPLEAQMLQADPGYASCVRNALDEAVQKVGVPLVTVVHRSAPAAALASRR